MRTRRGGEKARRGGKERSEAMSLLMRSGIMRARWSEAARWAYPRARRDGTRAWRRWREVMVDPGAWVDREGRWNFA